MNAITRAAGLCLIIISTWGQAATLTFAVVPQQSASKIAKVWNPILKAVAAQSGHSIVLKTAPDIPTFEARLAAEEYDLAYMNPYHYTVFSQNPGYQAFAKRAKQPISGIVVVRKEDPATELADLATEMIAFPSPAAFAASLLPRAELSQRNIAFHPKYVSSHDSVYINVAKGLTRAGGGVKRTYAAMGESVRSQLRILWQTPPFTPHAFAAHPRVPTDVIQQVQQAFVQLYQTPAGQQLLKVIKVKHGIVPAVDTDWDDVRRLNLQELQKYSAPTE